MPPIELRVEWTERVTTAATSCDGKTLQKVALVMISVCDNCDTNGEIRLRENCVAALS